MLKATTTKTLLTTPVTTTSDVDALETSYGFDFVLVFFFVCRRLLSRKMQSKTAKTSTIAASATATTATTATAAATTTTAKPTINPANENTMRILVASDNHLGYREFAVAACCRVLLLLLLLLLSLSIFMF